MNFDLIYTFIAASAMLALSPGPDNIFVMLQSMTHGVRFGLATVAGLMTGCLVHTSLVALGVSAVIKQSELLFTLLKFAGALYLFYLAYKVFRSPSGIDLRQGATPRKSVGKLYIQGFFMNVLNPKVSIFFLAFFPGFLFSDSMSHVAQFYVLGGLFIMTSFIVFGLIAILAGKIAGYVGGHKGVGSFLKWLQIVVFTGLGIFILLSEN
ncbi:LysE family translocator [Robertkochia solimangrovi]|uniref:LysE family translocator n=1 Tax=Robertkochia solimangrovi TaxID=2213046 RepID=UPI00117D1C4A|nr:LysE family translocator [Robertkochia solimangrovi]TRZ42759.1 LysE family translocator [Robertkochia solimangrovi]